MRNIQLPRPSLRRTHAALGGKHSPVHHRLRVVPIVAVLVATLFGSVLVAASPASAVSSRDFSLRLTPSVVSLNPGASASLRVSIVRGRKFRSSLTYRVSSTLPTIGTSVQLARGGASVSVAVSPQATGALGQVLVTATGGGRTRTALATVQIVAPALPPPAPVPPAPAPTVAPPVVGDFTVSVDQPILSMVTGSSAVLGVFVNPISGYTGSPRFEVAGLPAGVTGSFVNASSRTGTNLVLTAALGAARGDLPIVIRGIDGDKVRQVAMLLRVAGVGPFAMAAAFEPPRSAPGGSATLKVQLVSAGGLPIPEVEVSVGGLPNGATLSPAVVRTNTTATFLITFASTTPSADYTISVRGVSGQFIQGLSPVITVSSKPLVTLATFDTSVAQGGSAQYQILYSPVGGISTPAYTVTGTPAGATSTISSTVDGRLFVVITTSAATPKAAYNLALNAQSGSQITQVPFILRVT